jgi:hypothetical protein
MQSRAYQCREWFCGGLIENGHFITPPCHTHPLFFTDTRLILPSSTGLPAARVVRFHHLVMLPCIADSQCGAWPVFGNNDLGRAAIGVSLLWNNLATNRSAWKAALGMEKLGES